MGDIFVLEKEPLLAYFITKYMTEAGHNIIKKATFNDIMDSLNKGENLPDLILIDGIDGMKGEDMCYMIKEQDYKIPVIPIIENQSCSREMNKSCDHKCHGYLNIPFTRRNILDKINPVIPRDDIQSEISDFATT